MNKYEQVELNMLPTASDIASTDKMIVYDLNATAVFISPVLKSSCLIQMKEGMYIHHIYRQLSSLFQKSLPDKPVSVLVDSYKLNIIPSLNTVSQVIGGTVYVEDYCISATSFPQVKRSLNYSIEDIFEKNLAEAQKRYVKSFDDTPALIEIFNNELTQTIKGVTVLILKIDARGVVKDCSGGVYDLDTFKSKLEGRNISSLFPEAPDFRYSEMKLKEGVSFLVWFNVVNGHKYYKAYCFRNSGSAESFFCLFGIPEDNLPDEKYTTSRDVLIEENRLLSKHIQERTKSLEAANDMLKAENFERRLAESALKKSEERFRIAVESVSDVIYEWDVLSGYINWFGNIDSLLGYRQGEFPRTKIGWEEIIHPEDYPKVTEKVKQHLKTSEPYSDEYRVKRKNGKYLYWRDRGTLLLDESGELHKWIGVMSNITVAKEVEEALVSSEEQFRSLVSATAQIVWTSDPYGNVDDIPLWRNYTGQNAIEVAGFGWLSAIHEEDQAGFQLIWKNALRNRASFETEFKLKGNTGDYRYFQIRGVPIMDKRGCIKKWVGTCLDINDKKLIENALRKSEESYRYLSEALPQIIWSADTYGNINYFNSWTYQYTGLQQEDLLGWNWLKFIHPDDVEWAVSEWKGALEAEEPLKAEFRISNAASDEYKWHLHKAVPIKDTEDKVVKWIGSSIDIDDQKKREKTLRDNEELKKAQISLRLEKEFTENLINNSIDGIVAFDKAGMLTVWNKVMEQNSGLQRGEVIGRSVHDVFPEFSQSKGGKVLFKVFEGEKVVLYTVVNFLKKGYYEIRMMPVYDEKMQVIGGLGFIHDITERRKAEKERTNQKLKQQKEILTAILQAQEDERKRIAETLHNGLGQLLYAVKLNLESLTYELNSMHAAKASKINNDVSSLLDEAIKETRTISFQLMPTILEDFGLKTVLKELCKKISSPLLSINCKVDGLESRLDTSLEIALYRIIQELLNNIIKHAQASEANIFLSKSGTFIHVTVTDNGIGFQYDNILLTDKGTGLRSIKNRIKLLAGALYVKSEYMCGTRVTIEIPVKKWSNPA
jgi:PAS domain S-box-containing protein